MSKIFLVLFPQTEVFEFCNIIVLNSVFCLNCYCVLITSLYWERFYIWPARYWEYRDIDHRYIHRYTGNIVISKIMSRFHCIPKFYQPGSPGVN